MSDTDVSPLFQYPSNAMDVAGVDLSLTATGIATRRGTKTIRAKQMSGPRRLMWLRDAILYAIRNPMIVVLEGYSYASTNQGPQMGELGGVIKVALHEANIEHVVVPPTVVKKYATGKGNATKGQVLTAACMRAGEDFDGDDNQADAWWLRQMGVAHYHGNEARELPDGVVRARKIPLDQQRALDKIEWPEL